jgi:hypothetical protein
MMILKNSSVIHEGLQPEMYYALGVAAGLKAGMFSLNLVVTSLLDGHHNDGSLHPLGRAADVRSSDLTSAGQAEWIKSLQTELEPMGFDVVPEKVGSTPETTAVHVHIESDPKGRQFWHYLSAQGYSTLT